MKREKCNFRAGHFLNRALSWMKMYQRQLYTVVAATAFRFLMRFINPPYVCIYVSMWYGPTYSRLIMQHATETFTCVFGNIIITGDDQVAMCS